MEKPKRTLDQRLKDFLGDKEYNRIINIPMPKLTKSKSKYSWKDIF